MAPSGGCGVATRRNGSPAPPRVRTDGQGGAPPLDAEAGATAQARPPGHDHALTAAQAQAGVPRRGHVRAARRRPAPERGRTLWLAGCLWWSVSVGGGKTAHGTDLDGGAAAPAQHAEDVLQQPVVAALPAARPAAERTSRPVQSNPPPPGPPLPSRCARRRLLATDLGEAGKLQVSPYGLRRAGENQV